MFAVFVGVLIPFQFVLFFAVNTKLLLAYKKKIKKNAVDTIMGEVLVIEWIAKTKLRESYIETIVDECVSWLKHVDW